MKNTHTPGPWAKVYGAIMKDGKTICEFREHTSEAEQDLIAAAPDLLDALNRAYNALAWPDPDQTAEENEELLESLREALRKAKGEA
jgi:hypothetical protein